MRYLTTIIFLAISSFLTAQDNFQFKTGDLLFQDLDCGPFCEAIEKVTEGFDGLDFSHVGIACIENNKTFVLEASGRGVVKIPIDSFLIRSLDSESHPKVVVGRLKPEYQYTIPKAVKKSISLLGKKYDDYFDINNDRYYCSELVYYSFVDSTGNSLFHLAPMTFIAPGTQQLFPAWADYFRALNVPVPEGKPGLNPGGISRSDKIIIVFRYYQENL